MKIKSAEWESWSARGGALKLNTKAVYLKRNAKSFSLVTLSWALVKSQDAPRLVKAPTKG